MAKPDLTELMEIAISDITPRVSLREFRTSLWWFGVVFLCERFVRFSIFMGELTFDLPAILAIICGTNSRPDDPKWMFRMRALMVWCVCITIRDIYWVTHVPELNMIQPEQQVQARIYLMCVLSVKLVWSTINLFLLWRDKRSSQQAT